MLYRFPLRQIYSFCLFPREHLYLFTRHESFKHESDTRRGCLVYLESALRSILRQHAAITVKSVSGYNPNCYHTHTTHVILTPCLRHVASQTYQVSIFRTYFALSVLTSAMHMIVKTSTTEILCSIC
jgi:hypothetical protein